MSKTLNTIIAVLVLPLALSACQADKTEPVNKPAATAAPAAETKEAPVDLNGTWKAEGIEAFIGDNDIEINIVSTDSASLYWKGTFPGIIDGKVTSVADTEALSMSMLGSQDAEKVFTVEDDEINFKLSIAGTTKTIRMKKA